MLLMAYHPYIEDFDFDGQKSFNQLCTIAAFAGMVPFGLMMSAFTWLRIYYFQVVVANKFRCVFPSHQTSTLVSHYFWILVLVLLKALDTLLIT